MSENAPRMSHNIFESTDCLTHKQLLAYADNTLNSVEKHHFEKHLIDCPLCSDAVDGIMNRNNCNETKEIIEDLNIEINNKIKSKSSASSWKKYIYNIAAALLIGVGYIYLSHFPLSDSHDLFNTYFKAHPNTVPILRGDDTKSNDLQFAMIEYEKNNYEESLYYLQKVLSYDKNHSEANFYSGISYLCLGNPTKAISFLKHKQEVDTRYFVNATHWYLGLAYILNENNNLAEIQFKHLIQTDNRYTEISKKIIYKLEQM